MGFNTTCHKNNFPIKSKLEVARCGSGGMGDMPPKIFSDCISPSKLKGRETGKKSKEMKEI